MDGTFTLAHLSDVHLQPMPPVGPGHWRPKRALGYANWHRNRRTVHLREVVELITADLAAQPVDHIAVTGDLVNIGLPQEHELALKWLHSVGSAEDVTVVPGNHDIYVRLMRDPGAMRWRAYMLPNAEGKRFVAEAQGSFPFVRIFGRIALVGVNSAVPMPPVIAAGRIGREQLMRLGVILDDLGRERFIRVVLIHHPPLPGQASWSRGLRDATALERVLEAYGAELVLHGHNHRHMLTWLRRRGGAVPVVGIASASIGRAHKDEPLGRYNLLRIQYSGEQHRIELVGRGLADPDGPVVEVERRWLEAPAHGRH